jgi:hypothetical protein
MKPVKALGNTVMQRLSGDRPSRLRASVGAATVYRGLRS